MSLFNEIAGLKGENLSSAILAHLLLRSPDARDAFISKVSDISPIGPIYRQNHFAVFCEQQAELNTEDGDGKQFKGRLDILVETDDAVIGIENKFYAPFQDEQPECYMSHLKKTAHSLTKLRGTSFSKTLLVLAPKSRRKEIESRLEKEELKDCATFLSWEALLDTFSNLKGSSTVDRFLIRELDQYVRTHIGRLLDIPRLLPHLRRRWTPRGTSAQRQFLNGFIWSLLDDSVKIAGQQYQTGVGNDYYGWYLYPNPHDRKSEFWIGFINNGIDGKPGPELFVSATTAELIRKKISENNEIERVEYDISGWREHGWTCFRIPFMENKKWEKPETWAAALKPLNDTLQLEAKDSGAIE